MSRGLLTDFELLVVLAMLMVGRRARGAVIAREIELRGILATRAGQLAPQNATE